jgi:hypothetical protein
VLSLARQIAPLRRLAIRALESYPLVDPRLRFITHGENTTFRVDGFMVDTSTPATSSRHAAPGSHRFLLRIHRPRRHGRHVDSAAAAREVAFWLWFVGNAQVNPEFRDNLDREVTAIGRSLDTIL